MFQVSSFMTYNNRVQLSPNSLNLFLECPCCFWLDKKGGIKRPSPYPYALNMAVDALLKEEFDIHRAKGGEHPLLSENNIPAKLFHNQELLNQWRSNFSGIRFYDEKLDAVLFGAVDDILEFQDGRLSPLDYKSTGSSVATVYDRFQLQMDIYTYLLERNGFITPRKGYLAFYIVDKINKKELHEIETNPDDVRDIFASAISVLRQTTLPAHSSDCKFGFWFSAAAKF